MGMFDGKVNPKSTGTCSLNVRQCPIVTRDAFRQYCIDNGLSMQAVVVHLIEDALRTKRKFPEACNKVPHNKGKE